jgi:alkylmercury lyase
MEIDERTVRLRRTTSFDSMSGLCRPLLRLLADGQPVSIEDLAATAGRPVDDIHQTIASFPDIELDDQGRIVGYGLTLRETPHHFEVDGKCLYTWCALDTLVFPALLGRTARIESPCHGTGTTVRVTVGPTGVTSVDPATAVVSIVVFDKPDSIRGAFCDHVHFFESTQSAQGWLDEHPAGTVHAVAAAFGLGQPLVETLLEQRPADPECCR